MKNILFYIEQLYYWPSLKPVYDEFARDDNYALSLMIGRNSKRYCFVILRSQRKTLEKQFERNGYRITGETGGYDVVFCGSQIKNPGRFGNALLCNLDHGPGIKSLRYRHFLKQPDTRYICFVEGPYRVEKFKKYGLDRIETVYDVGLPKLDVFFNGSLDREKLIETYDIDPEREIVLYAPSYKPTSIFFAAEAIAALSERYNVIFKLHPYSWSGKYAPRAQHRFVERLKDRFPGIRIVGESDHDILPYLFIADTMISDGSSVINEFLALERCGIIIDIPQKTYRDGQPVLEEGNDRWLKNSFIHVSSRDRIAAAVEEALNPAEETLKNLKMDKEYMFSRTDGKSASRVKERTEELLEKRSRNAGN